MRSFAPARLSIASHKGGEGVVARLLSIVLALSLVVSICSVHSALAHADGPNTPTVAMAPSDPDSSDHSPDLVQAIHLAGHLTCMIAPAIVVGAAQEAVTAPRRLTADFFPLSSTLPAPSEPPRA